MDQQVFRLQTLQSQQHDKVKENITKRAVLPDNAEILQASWQFISHDGLSEWELLVFQLWVVAHPVRSVRTV